MSKPVNKSPTTAFETASDVFIPKNSNLVALNAGNQLFNFSNIGNDATFNTGTSRSLKLQMPRMTSNYEKSPDVFMNVLEDRLKYKYENINQAHWKTHLCAALEHTQHEMWFNKSILFSKTGYSWDDMKRMVIEKFSHVDKKQVALRKLSTIKRVLMNLQGC